MAYDSTRSLTLRDILRATSSGLPDRPIERIAMFSSRSAQRFLSVHVVVHNTNVQRHLVSRRTLRLRRAEAMAQLSMFTNSLIEWFGFWSRRRPLEFARRGPDGACGYCSR